MTEDLKAENVSLTQRRIDDADGEDPIPIGSANPTVLSLIFRVALARSMLNQ